MNTKTVWSIAAAAALLLGACSSDGGSDTAAGESAGGAESSDSSGAESSDSSSDVTEVEFESPLGEFLGWSQGVDFDEEAAQAEWAEKDRQVQEAIAVCMAEQGFEYVPIDTSAQNAFFEEQFNEGLEWGSQEWTEKYGFGLSTQRFSQEQVGPDLVGNTYSQGPSEDDGFTDPNQDYVDSLGDNERNAYYDALYGDDDAYPVPIWEEEGREPTEEEIEAFDREFQENYQPSGCEPIAYAEIYDEGGASQERWEAFDEAFGDALQEMEERMESHPDVVAYRAGVRACVEERGLEYLDEAEAYEFFSAALSDAGLGWESDVDPFEGIDTTDFTDEDFERVWQESQRQLLSPDKLAALAEVQEAEIATAVALRECSGGWQAEQAELQSVRVELEEEFLAANADRLAEFEGVFGN